MSLQARGGIPRNKNVTIDTTGRFVQFDALSMWVHLRTATSPVRVFHNEDDFLADINYFEQAVGEPAYSLPIEDRGVWLKGVGGNAVVQMVVVHRKG